MRTIAFLVLSGCLAGSLWGAAPQEKRPRSRREYDLFNSVLKTSDANAKLPLLDQWSQEYPETDYFEERAKFYVDAYFQNGRVQKAVEAARQVPAPRQTPSNLRSYWLRWRPLRGLPMRGSGKMPGPPPA